MQIIQESLAKMSVINKPQQKFLQVLFTTILLMRGKVNFTTLGRYSKLSEKTFRNGFRRGFDFTTFNCMAIARVVPASRRKILGMDASFLHKSGKKTYGLDWFYNGCAGRAEKGLEISLLALIDVDGNHAYALEARQTPAREEMRRSYADEDKVTRTRFYLDYLQSSYAALPEATRAELCCGVFDGYYAKKSFVDGVCDMGLGMVSKLRIDANLRYLYEGPKQLRGRPRLYDGKVSPSDLNRFDYAGTLEDAPELHLYTANVNHVSLKRTIRVVVMLDLGNPQRPRYTLLFSTDLDLTAQDIVLFYKARFQLEFLFRDAKQFVGLADCQARDQPALRFHINASFTAVNLAKLEILEQQDSPRDFVFSLSTYTYRAFNEHLLETFIRMFDLETSLIKTHPNYSKVLSYGTLAA